MYACKMAIYILLTIINLLLVLRYSALVAHGRAGIVDWAMLALSAFGLGFGLSTFL